MQVKQLFRTLTATKHMWCVRLHVCMSVRVSVSELVCLCVYVCCMFGCVRVFWRAMVRMCVCVRMYE